MSDRKKFILGIIAVVVLFSVLTTALLGSLILSNYQQLGKLFSVTRLIKTHYLEPVTVSQLIDGAMKGMVSGLKDPYSVYMDAEEYRHLFEQIEGRFSGVGLYVGMPEPNKLTVMSPIKGGPAAEQGIMAGDLILKIDGQDTLDMDLDKAVSLMKGPEGTEVSLSIFRESAKKILDFKLVRRQIQVPTVEGNMLEGHPGLGYIHLIQFNHMSAMELEKTYKELEIQGLKGLIFDLRDNPGGDLTAAVEVASFFVPEGPVVHIVDRAGTRESLTALGNPIKVPFVVLVNEGSASASEIVAGAIKDTGTGLLIGQKTFGKGIVQTVFSLPQGAGVKLTTAKYLTPKNNDIHKIGIEPDIKVENPINGSSDPQLQRAIQELLKKVGK